MKHTSILILLFYSLCSFAQTIENDSIQNYYTEIGFGIAIPQQDFAYTMQSNNEGYATKGFCLNASAKTYSNNYFGFILSGHLMVNPVDDSFYEIDVQNSTMRADIGMWKNINFGIGPLLYFNNESIILELGLPIGFMATNRPEVLVYNYDASNGSINRLYTYTGGHALSFATAPEFALIFNLSKKSQIKISTYYLMANSNINYELSYGNQVNSSTAANISSLNQEIKIRSLNAGVSFIFKLEK